ncbi:hypothetical protein H0920_14075 [Acinetobacter sp. C_4_1]|uniref:hypothetical protein n=1 Tax=unclassified Acinetobacter TaxID=196816 RepID=UPI0021B840EC|nr:MULTISPECIES: hypothetical protein [unclassified Acinetobacter]MCT8090651.1 hypothetical protein [Acinetobacter sp. F_3_1]MCT8099129.1 hypothetical protein [Acinetobacter sp. C_3_1]MCT8102202.1 hypothetical protein [Acinetobacter sp. C_4_1]MCT8135949.1 hypothetical protein [Acinetobacter sp. T_3_1]
MKAFFLNSTRILEHNTKIYWSIIFGIAACLILFIAEAVHIQNFMATLNTQDQNALYAAIQPLTQRYSYSRYLVLVLALLWTVYEYISTKKKLGL